MRKRRRGSLPATSSSQAEDTPSKHTRRQTQTAAGAERAHGALHADSGIDLESSPERRRRTRGRSIRIETDAIMHSPEMISSPTELSPSDSQETNPDAQLSLESQDPAAGYEELLLPQMGATSGTDTPSQYRPPKRQPPANPRRQSTPVPGTAPKAALGDRLRLAADRANKHNFKYDPIRADQVRLMKLERGEPNDPIKIAVMTVPFQMLGDRYLFEALSYHWGEDNASRPLFIRDISRPPPKIASLYQSADHLRRREIRVKYNLYEALYHLRSSAQDLWFWVDALCIDQDNPKEKEVQVARIADIYVAAENVLIWLGEGNKHTRRAIKLLRDLASVEQQSEIFADRKRLPEWKDLTHLMKASWFSRRWVIQELALAKNAIVYCGNEEIHWNDVRDGVSLFVESEDLIRAVFHQSPDFDHDYHALEDPEPLAAKILIEKVGDVFRKNARADSFVATQGLEDLVSSLFAFHTSDPRDTINALINISKEGIGLGARVRAQVEARSQSRRQQTAILDAVQQSHIAPVLHLGKKHPPPPSYRKDLLDVYVDFLKWIVDSTGSINVLCRHWAIPERSRQESGYPELVKLPTWIKVTSEGPFKHTEQSWYRQNADSLVGLPGESPYNACDRYNDAKIEFYVHEASELASSGPVPLDLRKSASAKVKGLRLGTIHSCTDPMSGGNITMHALDMLGWKRGLSAQHLEELKDDIWRPLVAERGYDGKNPPPLWRKCCMDILVNHTTRGSVNIDMIMPKIKLPHTKQFLKRMRQVTWNRRFLEMKLDTVFMTASCSKSHSVGLGPSDAQIGRYCVHLVRLFGPMYTSTTA